MRIGNRPLSLRKLSVIIVILFIVVAALIVSKSNPALSSLKHSTPSAQFNKAFWVKQAKAKSKLWFKALAYCNKHQTPTPGCKTVEGVAWGLNAYKFPKQYRI